MCSPFFVAFLYFLPIGVSLSSCTLASYQQQSSLAIEIKENLVLESLQFIYENLLIHYTLLDLWATHAENNLLLSLIKRSFFIFCLGDIRCYSMSTLV